MKDGARIAAAIEIVETILARPQPAKDALRDWSRGRRFAGAADRAWISGLVLDALRRRGSVRFAMGDERARALVIGALGFAWGLSTDEIEALFEGDEHAPPALSAAERAGLSRSLEKAPIHARGEFPDWLEPSFRRAFGPEAAEEGAALSMRAPVDLRVNRVKTEPEKALAAVAAKLTAEASDLALDAIRIPAGDPRAKAPAAEAIPAYGKGWVEVQDLGSQLAALAAAPGEGAQVLDYCAGAGGKTLALAALMNETGQVYAWDYDWRRLWGIWPRLKRAEPRNVQVRDGQEDEALGDLAGKMDVVFVDAPCTGSGVWRRRPEAKWRLKPDAVKARVKDQNEVLDKAARYVKPGGRLVYVTCSVLPEENDDRIAAFLARHRAFDGTDAAEAMTRSGRLADGAAARLSAFANRLGAVQLTPLRTGTDGFYVSVMDKRSG